MSLTKAEINFLINEHGINATLRNHNPENITATYGLMELDRWGVNYPNQHEPVHYIVGKDRNLTKKQFKREYRLLRMMNKDSRDDYFDTCPGDCDPAGGYGLHSHE